MRPASEGPSESWFGSTPHDSAVSEVAFALAAYQAGSWRPSGTAVSIAPGLLLTAKHVLEDYWSRFDSSRPMRGPRQLNFGVLARQIIPEGEGLALWEATRFWASAASDLAFLRVRPVSKAAIEYPNWRVPALQLQPPSAGSRVAAFGYHTPKIQVSLDGDQVRVEWDDHPATSVGVVTNTFSQRRDSAMLTFPWFQTDSRFEGGMSGGPIFDDAGQVCGLVCSTLVGDLETGHTSYGVSLWPALATRIHLDADNRECLEPNRVFDLVRAGLIKARGLERVSMERSEGGVRISLDAGTPRPTPNKRVEQTG